MSQDTNDLRIAIVGCGRMGTERARAAHSLGARVAAMCDVDVARAQTLAQEFAGCRAIGDVAQLDWSAIDAVFVCTPPVARGPVERQALEVGVPLFVEKPIGRSAGQLQSILDMLERRPAITAVGYMNRSRPSVAWLRERLAGKPILGIAANWICGIYRTPWWAQADQSGGPINEQCTHLVDLCRYLAGDVDEVHAMLGRLPNVPDIDGLATISLRFRSGAVGTILYSCLATTKQIGLRVFSPEAEYALEGWDFQLRSAEFHEPTPEMPVFTIELARFFEAIRAGRADGVAAGFADAFRTQQVVDAIKVSAAQGHSVRLAESGALDL
jgi:myo-inositol 2-dehydrogenase / D-chiro-inositol 1-dehydrogenase